MADIEETIREKIEEIRVMLQNDGGDCEIVKQEGKNVWLKLKGACGGCPHAQATLKAGIQQYLRENVDPEIIVERA